MSDEYETSMSVPLDSDGFLRRECPTCEREFKWFASPEGADGGANRDATPMPEGGYYCPYCAVQAPGDAWFTKQQLEVANAIVMQEFVEPELKKLDAAARRASGGFVEIKVERDELEEPQELTETDDMRRVDFGCHPDEPVKVLDEWTGPVRCLICGQPAS
jgi:hypothetical protein